MEAILKVDDTNIPDPTSITISRNKVWAQNTGRTKSGKYVGDLIAVKWRIDATWNNISETKAQEIINAFEPSFVNIRFKNPKTKSFATAKFYSGDETLNVYNYEIEQAVYESVSLSIVEV